MGIDDDNPEFWFDLLATTAFYAIPLAVAPIGKISHICDKRAKMCGHPMGFMPSIFGLAFFALAYLGLMIPGTFIHVDEGKPRSDDFYDDVNWIVFSVGVLMMFWPHVYTMDYYSSKRWKTYFYSSYPFIAGICNILYWLMLIAASLLMSVAVVFTGIDHRWVTMGVYIGYTALLIGSSLYFALEWFWCGGLFRRFAAYYEGSKTVIEIVVMMEREAEKAQKYGVTVEYNQQWQARQGRYGKSF